MLNSVHTFKTRTSIFGKYHINEIDFALVDVVIDVFLNILYMGVKRKWLVIFLIERLKVEVFVRFQVQIDRCMANLNRLIV